MHELVDTMRKAASALRRLNRSGGHTAATTNAITRRQQTYDAALRALTESGDEGKTLAGEVAAESNLLTNIDQRIDNHAGYHELACRLHGVRRNIRRLIAEKECVK